MNKTHPIGNDVELKKLRETCHNAVGAKERLIAAAPDLLVALQTLESLYGELRRQHIGQFSESDRHITRKAIVNARAAIAKATQP